MANPRVLTSFSKTVDNSLPDVARTVIQGLTDNSAFPNPPVSLVALQAATTEFIAALVAQAQGGTLATAIKKKKREALVHCCANWLGTWRTTATAVSPHCSPADSQPRAPATRERRLSAEHLGRPNGLVWFVAYLGHGQKCRADMNSCPT